MKKFCLLFLITLFHLSALYSQTRIHGKITAGKEFIPGANIIIKDTYDGASSDKEGKFSFLTYEKGEKIMVVSSVGYELYEQKIKIEGSELEVNPIIKQTITELDLVTISVGSFEASEEKKSVMLRPLDIVTTAGSKGDLYGAIQTLPGSQTIGETEGLFVRGGAGYETKTIMDDMLIPNPFYSSLPDIAQRGRFSPFMFKGTVFNTGGYSAQYGQALSSVLLLNSRDLPPRTTTDLSIMAVGLGASHTHKWKNSSATLSGNYINLKPYYSFYKRKPDWDSEPESKDFGFHYKWKTSSTGIFKFFSGFSRNYTSLNYSNIDNGLKDHFSMDNTNLYVNTSYAEMLNHTWSLYTGYSGSYNKDDMKRNDIPLLRNQESNHGRISLTKTYGRFSDFKFGGEIIQQKIKHGYNNYFLSFTKPLSSVFTETDLFITPKIATRIGVRYENSELINKENLAPRTSLSIKTGKKSQASFAWGKFYQVPENEFTLLNDSLDFENAEHFIVNFQKLDEEKRTFRIEAYYKKYDDLIAGIRNNYQWIILDNSGSGFARGIDVFWRDKSLPMIDYWLSYSYLDTKRKYLDYKSEATPTFAAKHTFNIVYKHFIPKITTSVGFTYTYATGRPYFNPNNPEYLADNTPDYHNLSFTASYLTAIKDHFTVIYTGIGNIIGYKNIYGYRYSKDGTKRQEITSPTLVSVFIGMFITFGEDRVRN